METTSQWVWTLFLIVVMIRVPPTLSYPPLYPEVFYSTNIEPFYDDTGLEVTEDQILEMADMKSTTLGMGFGFNYSFPAPPVSTQGPNHIGAGPSPSSSSSSSSSSSFPSPSSSSFLSPSSSSSSLPSSPSRRYSVPFSQPSPTVSATGTFPKFAFRRFKRQAIFDKANSLGDQVFNTYGTFTTNNNNNNNDNSIFGLNPQGFQVFNGHPGFDNINNNNNNNGNANNNHQGNNGFQTNSLGDQVFSTQRANINNNVNFDGRSFQNPSSSDFTVSIQPSRSTSSSSSSSRTSSSSSDRDPFLGGGTFGQFPSITFDGFSQEDKKCAPPKPVRCDPRARYRTIDGSCNNLANPTWGAINQPMRRILPAVYFDGYDVPRLTSAVHPRRLLPCARLVSRTVHEPADIQRDRLTGLTNLLQVWGQFLAHDITGTPAHKGPDGRDLRCCDGVFLSESQQVHRDAFEGGRCNPIYIPPQDRHFTYSCMNFARSVAAKRKRDCDQNAPKEIRQQMNMLTAWVDASQVYGSTKKKADELRVYNKGLLKVIHNDLLPEDTNSTCVKEEPGDYCFLAGEKRANEHAALMALHIVFHRYHNDMANKLAQLNPRWSDEKIYQEARRVMSAIMQHVTYHDWLPAVLGPDVMKAYSLNVMSAAHSGPSVWRYNSKLDPTIMNSFATAAFRFGHTMVPSLFTMGDVQVRLFTMFNRPRFILQNRAEGLQKMCSGMIHDPAQASSRFMARDLSDRLFEDRHNVSMDLGALNIHRGRDHALPPYMKYREFCGLPTYKTFEEMYRAEPDMTDRLRQVYEDVGDVDLFAGGLSERPLPGAVVGPTFACLLATQFHSLKFADRYWYETPGVPAAFTQAQLREVGRVTLSRLMCRTTSMPRVAANPLYQAGVPLPRALMLPTGALLTRNRYVSCESLPEIDFRHWYDPNAQL